MYLIHYASKYYDPVKAHEYYLKTRELKGRQSTSSLNEEGKSTVEYVKSNLNAEKKQKLAEEKNNRDSRIETAQTTKETAIDKYANRTNLAIDQLREKLKSMSSAEKARNRDMILTQISRLRENNANAKLKLNNAYKKSYESISSDYSTKVDAIKNEYENLYLDELDKIKSESKYLKKSSSKGTKSSGSNGSKKTSESNYKRYTYKDLKRDTTNKKSNNANDKLKKHYS